MVFTGSVLFSTKAIIIKLAYRYDIDSLSLLSLRMLFALPFFLLAALWASRNEKLESNKIERKDWILLIVLGCLGYYLASLFDFLGLQYISASLERLILFMYPTFVLLISAFFFKIKVKKIQLLALAITYAGIALALTGDQGIEVNPNFKWGIGFVFLSALSFALFLVGSYALVKKLGTVRFTSWSMTVACLAILIHHFSTNDSSLLEFPFEVYWLSLLMATIATFIPSFMVIEGLRRIGAGNAAIISSVGPISTIILAYIFLGERLVLLQWLGTLLVIGGVLLISLYKQNK